MIINISKVKTEALLLFIRDLIDSYSINKEQLFDLSEELKKFIDTQILQLHKAISASVEPIDYYVRNKNVFRIAMIIKVYEHINHKITQLLQKGNQFNPSMLCFALLSTWFAELGKENYAKEFLYFSLYPYGEVYDMLLIGVENRDYKQLNTEMLQVAESTIVDLNTYRIQ